MWTHIASILIPQLVESPYLQKLQDLFHSEANLSDGVHLTCAGLEGIMGIKKQQYAMHCDAMFNDLRVVYAFSLLSSLGLLIG